MGRVDLHVHTTASDGALTPTLVVELAAQSGVEVLGIADHDSTDGIADAQDAAMHLGVQVVPAVEINAEFARSELHVLGYYLDPAHERLQETLRSLRDGRLRRAHGMVAALNSMGLGVEWDRVAQLAGAGSAVGRPHVAQAMVERGHVDTVEEAFAQHIGRGRPAYVERVKLRPDEAVRLVREAGGLPVLAHPLRLMDVVPELMASGLAGIEAYYTGYTPKETALLLSLAAKHGLLVTGGSDFHGGGVLPGSRLGGVPVPSSVALKLEAAAGQARRLASAESP